MAAHPNPWLMTVEEFYELPEREDVMLELHWGQLVELGRPKYWHVKMQMRIAALLAQRCGPDWSAIVELPFRAVPQNDVRAADVGVVSKRREDEIGDGDLFGSPEIVIEILSPSNRRKEIEEKMRLCLSTGAQQFCVVDHSKRTVTITTSDGARAVYRGDDEIPFLLLGASIRVSEIWVD
jgi:Uma2 family endonuclease